MDRIKNFIKNFIDDHFKGLNPVAFFLSAFFVVYGMINLSEIVWIKCVMGVLGFYVEWVAQKIWGLSFTYKAAKKPYGWLRFLYVWYVIVFALLSGIGFFATEIKTQELQSENIEQINTNNQTRITQLFGSIDSVDAQMLKEGNTGVGKIYRGLEKKKLGYETELKLRLEGKLNPVQTVTKIQTKDMFSNVSEVLWGFPKYIILLLMFGSALAMIYIDLALSPVQVKLRTQSFSASKPPPLKTEEESKSVSEVAPKLSEDPRKLIYDPEDSYKSEFIQFVDRLYDCRDPFVRLNSIENMSEFPFSKKQRFKSELLQMGAIQIGQGKIAALWPKEEIIKNIRYVKREQG